MQDNRRYALRPQRDLPLGVAEQRLDFEDVDVVDMKQRRERVAQLMRTDPAFEDSGLHAIFSEDVPH